jgi:DNA-binding MarR family transcriptional regulator
MQMDLIAEARRQWEERWGGPPGGPGPPMAAVTSIMRAQQLLLAHLNDALKRYDLTFPRYEALMLLSFTRIGSLPLGKIGERLQVHPTSVTNTIDGLERSGYVRRVPHESDRRATLAEITSAGRRVARDATAKLNAERFFVEPLVDAELDRLTEAIAKLRRQEGDF